MTATDSSMGLNYRRRVIYHALHDTFTDPQEIRRYFDLWQRDHSHEAHFVVTRFAAVVAKAAGFDAQQKSVFQRRLFHGLTQSYETLPRVPDAWLPAAGPVQATVAAPQLADADPPVQERVESGRFDSPERVIFRAFAQPLAAAILAKADRHPGVLQQAVDDLGRTSRGPEQTLHQLFKDWSTQRFAAEAVPQVQAHEALRLLAHQLYLLAADLIGPMQADRLLAQAVSEAGQLPEAGTFSPQLLL